MSAQTAAKLRFEDLAAGQQLSLSRCFADAEMRAFEELSGDTSPIHVDAAAARRYGHPDRLLYGFLVLTMLSRLVGTRLHDAVCAAVSADFTLPLFPGETVELAATVDRVQEPLRSAVLKYVFQRGADVIARGRLTVQFLRE